MRVLEKWGQWRPTATRRGTGIPLEGCSRGATRSHTRFFWGLGKLAALIGCSLSPHGAAAEESPVVVHGFVSQGYIKTTQNNYLANTDGAGSFEFNEAGINFTKQFASPLRVGAQLFTRDLGPIGNYAAKFDWFYIDYRFQDWLGLRVGRTKLPFGLYNETSDIDAARVPVLLPQSVYPIQNRDYLLAQTGAELYGFVELGAAGALEYRFYGGTIFLDTSSSNQLTETEVPYLIGSRWMWLTPMEGLQLGASVQALRLDGTVSLSPETIAALEMQDALPQDFDGSASFELPAALWVASLEYAIHDLLLAAEYGRWHVRVKSDLPEAIPNSNTTSERFYLLASYQVTPWFTPGTYYSATFPDTEDRTGQDAYQHDLALTFRYDLNENWLLKLEGHYMDGTAGLSPSLNDSTPRAELHRNWGVFLAKTTAYF